MREMTREGMVKGEERLCGRDTASGEWSEVVSIVLPNAKKGPRPDVLHDADG
jgi:hypothetical protein